jgi:4'-phosphopantetheinyl transferase
MAEVYRKNIDDDTVYAIWHITESAGELYASINLRDEEEVMYDSFVAENRKKQWLAYRLLIRALLYPEDFPVEYDKSGKPFLAGSDYHISVTHTDDYAAVIMSRSSKVGIDVERIRPRVAKVKERFLNQDEMARLSADKELEQLTLAWCAKESLYKMYGIRTLDFREHIRLEIPPKAGISFRAEINYAGKKNQYTLFSEQNGDYVLVYLLESMI